MLVLLTTYVPPLLCSSLLCFFVLFPAFVFCLLQVYPGMKEISYESAPAVYLHLYQTPSRAGKEPAKIARKLWKVLQELPQARGRRDGGLSDQEEEEEDSTAERSLERSASKNKKKKKDNGNNNNKGTKMAKKKKDSTMKADASLEKEEDMEEDKADSDAVVALVYAVTKKTNAVRKEMARRGAALPLLDGVPRSEQQHERTVLPIGERRLCVVVSERFAMANGPVLKQWGCSNSTRVSGVRLLWGERGGLGVRMDGWMDGSMDGWMGGHALK